MQKKIAIMLILMMMAELDAHGARDLHPGLRKNFSYTNMVYIKNPSYTVWFIEVDGRLFVTLIIRWALDLGAWASGFLLLTAAR